MVYSTPRQCVLDEQPLDVGIRDDGEVGAPGGGCQVGVRGTLPHAVDDVRLDPRHAFAGHAVVVHVVHVTGLPRPRRNRPPTVVRSRAWA